MVRQVFFSSLFVGCCSLILLMSAYPSRSQGSDYFRIRAERLSCILQYSSRYLSGGDLIAIVVEDCGPNAEPADILSVLTNEVPVVSELEDGIDRYIVVTPEDFVCLGDQTVPEGVEFVRYYPSECRIEAE